MMKHKNNKMKHKYARDGYVVYITTNWRDEYVLFSVKSPNVSLKNMMLMMS